MVDLPNRLFTHNVLKLVGDHMKTWRSGGELDDKVSTKKSTNPR